MTRGVNIAAQFYQTDADVGYVVLDADGAVPDADGILAEIRANPGTIRARLEALISKGKASAMVILKARILLKADRAECGPADWMRRSSRRSTPI